MQKAVVFTEWWKTMTPMEKDRMSVELSDACNVAIFTVVSWGRGYRNPKERSKQTIKKYLETKGINITF